MKMRKAPKAGDLALYCTAGEHWGANGYEYNREGLRDGDLNHTRMYQRHRMVGIYEVGAFLRVPWYSEDYRWQRRQAELGHPVTHQSVTHKACVTIIPRPTP